MLLVVFLHLKHEKASTLGEKLMRVDLAGNAIFVLATTAVLIALTNGGTRYPWSAWHTIFALSCWTSWTGAVLCIRDLEPVQRTKLTSSTFREPDFGSGIWIDLLSYAPAILGDIFLASILSSSPRVNTHQVRSPALADCYLTHQVSCYSCEVPWSCLCRLYGFKDLVEMALRCDYSVTNVRLLNPQANPASYHLRSIITRRQR